MRGRRTCITDIMNRDCVRGRRRGRKGRERRKEGDDQHSWDNYYLPKTEPRALQGLSLHLQPPSVVYSTRAWVTEPQPLPNASSPEAAGSQ